MSDILLSVEITTDVNIHHPFYQRGKMTESESEGGKEFEKIYACPFVLVYNNSLAAMACNCGKQSF